MLKKFISMATAAILFGTGLSVIAVNPANASDGPSVTDASLNIGAVRIKGVTPGSAASYNIIGPLSGGFARTAVTLTADQASSTSGLVTQFEGTNPAAQVTIKKYANNAMINDGTYQGAEAFTSQTVLVDRDIIIVRVVSTNTLNIRWYGYTILVSGGSTPAPSTPTLTAAEIAAAAAAAARAAEAAAAAIRAAEIATAQTSLATVLRGDKAGSLSEYRAANINITTTAALTRLNAEVLKLSAADRTDFAKIKAIADKIEFDESFFNATARPSLATYSSYGVTGVTERILPVINAKVLELPTALRADVKAIQDLVKVENFVDRVANTETRSTVSANTLVEKGLLSSASPYKYSVVQGLARYPEGSLNTMAKIEAAIKEQIFIAEAPKRRLAEIKARMAARKK